MEKFNYDDLYLPVVTITKEQFESVDLKKHNLFRFVKSVPAMDQCVGNTRFVCNIKHPREYDIHSTIVYGYHNMIRFIAAVSYYGRYNCEATAISKVNNEAYKFKSYFDERMNKVGITFEYKRLRDSK